MNCNANFRPPCISGKDNVHIELVKLILPFDSFDHFISVTTWQLSAAHLFEIVYLNHQVCAFIKYLYMTNSRQSCQLMKLPVVTYRQSSVLVCVACGSLDSDVFYSVFFCFKFSWALITVAPNMQQKKQTRNNKVNWRIVRQSAVPLKF